MSLLQHTVAQRSIRGWVLCALLWVTALVPALGPVWAQWQAQDVPPGLLQVCTSTGMVWLPSAVEWADAAGSDEPPASAAAGMECPWCASHAAHTPLPPPADVGFVATTVRATTWPPEYDRPAPVTWVWRSAWTRGPPALA